MYVLNIECLIQGFGAISVLYFISFVHVFKLKLMYKEYVVVKRLLVVFLVMFAFEVYSEDEKEVVVGNAKELKDIKAKKITWKKDGAKMVLMIRS